MKLEKQLSDIILDIDLPNKGLFMMSRDSSVGKTYFSKLLNALSNTYSVAVVTYDIDKDILDLKIKKALKSQTVELIFFDRADMYMTKELMQDVLSKSEDCIILLDSKNIIKYNVQVTDIACVELTRERLMVY